MDKYSKEEKMATSEEARLSTIGGCYTVAFIAVMVLSWLICMTIGFFAVFIGVLYA